MYVYMYIKESSIHTDVHGCKYYYYHYVSRCCIGLFFEFFESRTFARLWKSLRHGKLMRWSIIIIIIIVLYWDFVGHERQRGLTHQTIVEDYDEYVGNPFHNNNSRRIKSFRIFVVNDVSSQIIVTFTVSFNDFNLRVFLTYCNYWSSTRYFEHRNINRFLCIIFLFSIFLLIQRKITTQTWYAKIPLRFCRPNK